MKEQKKKVEEKRNPEPQTSGLRREEEEEEEEASSVQYNTFSFGSVSKRSILAVVCQYPWKGNAGGGGGRQAGALTPPTLYPDTSLRPPPLPPASLSSLSSFTLLVFLIPPLPHLNLLLPLPDHTTLCQSRIGLLGKRFMHAPSTLPFHTTLRPANAAALHSVSFFFPSCSSLQPKFCYARSENIVRGRSVASTFVKMWNEMYVFRNVKEMYELVVWNYIYK